MAEEIADWPFKGNADVTQDETDFDQILDKVHLLFSDVRNDCERLLILQNSFIPLPVRRPFDRLHLKK